MQSFILAIVCDTIIALSVVKLEQGTAGCTVLNIGWYVDSYTL